MITNDLIMSMKPLLVLFLASVVSCVDLPAQQKPNVLLIPVDETVGLFREVLNHRDLIDNTLVFFYSDKPV